MSINTFIFIRASVPPILCITPGQYCSISLQVVPSEPFSNKLAFESAFSPKHLYRVQVRTFCRSVKYVHFRFGDFIFDYVRRCHATRSSWETILVFFGNFATERFISVSKTS